MNISRKKVMYVVVCLISVIFVVNFVSYISTSTTNPKSGKLMSSENAIIEIIEKERIVSNPNYEPPSRTTPKIELDEKQKLLPSVPLYDSPIRFTEINRKIDAVSLRKKIPASLNVSSCYYCGNPIYPKLFKLSNKKHIQNSFVDAFITTDEEGIEKVMILANHIDSLTRKELRYNLYPYELKVGGDYIKLQFLNEEYKDKVVKLDCWRSSSTYKPKTEIRLITYHCPIKDRSLLFMGCFKAMLYRTDNLELLTKPLLVRHCQSRKKMNSKELMLAKKNVAFVIQITQFSPKFFVEWVTYHLMIGVDHIYIYVHLGWNNKYYDTTVFAMLDYFIVKGQVTVFIWNFSNPKYGRLDDYSKKAGDQRSAYTDCYHRFGWKYKWFTFIDDDEYVVPVKADNIYDVLKQYERENDDENHMVYHYFYSRFKTGVGDILIESYPELDEKFVQRPCYSKAFIRSGMCDHYYIHECALPMRHLEQANPAKFTRIPDGLIYVAHYFYKKFDEWNPIMEKEKEIPKNSPMLRWVEPLKERLKLVREKMDFDSFGFVFNEKKWDVKKKLYYPECSKHRWGEKWRPNEKKK